MTRAISNEFLKKSAAKSQPLTIFPDFFTQKPLGLQLYFTTTILI